MLQSLSLCVTDRDGKVWQANMGMAPDGKGLHVQLIPLSPGANELRRKSVGELVTKLGVLAFQAAVAQEREAEKRPRLVGVGGQDLTE